MIGNRPSLVLLGAGGHARACIDVIEADGRYAIAGLVGLPEEVGGAVLGYPVLGGDADISALLGAHDFGVVTLGQIKTAEPRRRLFELIVRHGRAADPIVSPRAHVSRHAALGVGTMVQHGAVVNAGATIGANGIVNSLALVEHDVIVGDHCHVATGARVNSGVRIGDGTFLGSGCIVRQGLTIGRDCVVGMGQVVLADCADGAWLPIKKEMR